MKSAGFRTVPRRLILNYFTVSCNRLHLQKCTFIMLLFFVMRIRDIFVSSCYGYFEILPWQIP